MSNKKKINGYTHFDTMWMYYCNFNGKFLYEKTLYYLTAQDLDTDQNNPLPATNTFTLSQVGLLYSLDKKKFVKGRFDEKLLKFFARYRNRLTFVFMLRYYLDQEKIYLVRIHVTDASEEERHEINKFIADNLEKYPKFTRQTSEFFPNSSLEKIIDLNHINKIYSIPNYKKIYKDVTLTFGY
jgi:hypothetical protein